MEIAAFFNNAEVTVVTSPRGFPALEHNKLISENIIFDPSGVTFSAIRKISGCLKGKGYSLSINVSEKIWAYMIPFLAGIKMRIGFSPGYTQPVKALIVRGLLTHEVKYLNIPSKAMGSHEVERQLRLLEPLGIKTRGSPLSVALQPEDLEWARHFLKEHNFDRAGRKSADNDSKAAIAIHLSQKWLLEGWDMYMLSLFITSLLSMMKNVIFIATYSDAEMPWAQSLLDEIADTRLIACHGETFGKWASILTSTDLLITMDTSASHLASALQLPVIDIFHERYYAHCTERWYPWRVPYRLVEKRSIAAEAAGSQKRRAVEDMVREVIHQVRDMMKWENI